MAEPTDKQDFDQYAERVRDDHYLHWLAMISSAAYAWQLHTLMIAVLLLFGLIGLIAITNILILVKFQSLRLVRLNRWFWVVLAFVGLAISGASIETVG